MHENRYVLFCLSFSKSSGVYAVPDPEPSKRALGMGNPLVSPWATIPMSDHITGKDFFFWYLI